MPKRLSMTGADYVTIALSPALIMTLIGSLVFFLIEVFYRGQFSGRVSYVFALYVFAAVLVGRISIEEGNDRAVLFGIPLAVATLFVVNTFIAGHFLVNLTIIVIIWWCAHKLTWDCTVIDDREDASGEGLLHAAGLAPSAAESINADAPGEKETDEKNKEKNKHPSIADKRRAKEAGEESTYGTPGDASGNAPSVERTPSTEPPPSWWEQYVERRRRRHVPGVWVVYFSLAALPLFGLLNAAVPSSGRAFALRMLILYVGSALGLLLTTSFLGLRRYLRQRRLEMPAPMAGTWVGIGAIMIAAVLIFCSLLPLPAGDSSFWSLPIQFTSRDDLSASQYAILNREGVKDQSPGTAEMQRGAEPGSQTKSQPDSRSSPPPAADGNGTGQPSKSGSGGSKGKKSQQRKDNSKQPTNSNQQQKQQREQQQEQGQKQEQEKQPTEQQDRQQNQPKEQPQQRHQSQNRQSNEPKSSEKKDEEKQRRKSSASPSRSPPQQPWRPPIEPISGLTWVGALAKLLFFAALILLALYLLVRYRHRVAAALRQLIDELRDLWNSLWGGRKAQTAAEDEQPESVAAPPHPFADFADPFMSGAAQTMPPHELVRYSIAAFEAWSREHGHPRDPDLTVRELVHLVTPPGTPLARHARTLANLHGQAAYTDRPLTAAEVHRLRDLWYAMRG